MSKLIEMFCEVEMQGYPAVLGRSRVVLGDQTFKTRGECVQIWPRAAPVTDIPVSVRLG